MKTYNFCSEQNIKEFTRRINSLDDHNGSRRLGRQDN